MKAIIKVQVALSPRGAPALIYKHGRELMTHQALAPAVVRALGTDPKGYFDGEYVDGHWKIGARVANQSW